MTLLFAILNNWYQSKSAISMELLTKYLGKTLNGVLLSLAAFNLVQGLAVTLHHIRFSPLRRRGFKSFQLGKSSAGD
jgi:hypothetical protein